MESDMSLDYSEERHQGIFEGDLRGVAVIYGG